MTKQKHQLGFGTVGVLAISVAVLAVGGIGFTLYKKSSETKTAVVTGTNPTNNETVAEPPAQPKQLVQSSDKQYTNEKYGISFSYPKEWRIAREAEPSPQPDSPTPVEFGVTLSRISDEKYAATAVIEVHSKDFNSMRDFFAANYTDGNATAKLSKKEQPDKGKRSVYLATTYPLADGSSYTTQHYLFAVDSKTYSIRSINEELNLQVDPGYTTKFDRVYRSLKIQ